MKLRLVTKKRGALEIMVIQQQLLDQIQCNDPKMPGISISPFLIDEQITLKDLKDLGAALKQKAELLERAEDIQRNMAQAKKSLEAKL